MNQLYEVDVTETPVPILTPGWHLAHADDCCFRDILELVLNVLFQIWRIFIGQSMNLLIMNLLKIISSNIIKYILHVLC